MIKKKIHDASINKKRTRVAIPVSAKYKPRKFNMKQRITSYNDKNVTQ